MRLFQRVLVLTCIMAGIALAPHVSSAQEQRPPATVSEYIDAMARAVVRGDDAMRNRMFIKLRIVGEPAVKPLIKALDDKRPGVTEYVAFTLGWLASEEAVPHLTKLLDEADPDQTRATLKALGNMKAVKALPKMRPFLKSDNVEVRRDAVYSLGLLRDEQVLDDLQTATEDKDELVRFLANEAIERVKTGW